MARVYNVGDSNALLANAVYVGRPSKWGNPFRLEEYERDLAIELYATWLQEPEQEALRAQLGELRGRNLACWCAPKACHADVLLEAANGTS